jgi:hypothetical protein
VIVTDERVGQFVSRELGVSFCPPFTMAGIERDGEIVAGVIFNQFDGRDVHVTIAGTGWTPGFIKAVGRYVFDQLGCLRITATTRYPEVVDYAVRLGGKVEGRLRDYYGEGEDATIIGVLRREWRYAKHLGKSQG